MRKLWLTSLALVTGAAFLAATPAAVADTTLYTGRVDTAGTGVGVVNKQVRLFGLGSGGASWTNFDSANGTTVTAIGFAKVTTATALSSVGDVKSPNNLVGVYALQGTFTGSLPTNLAANFNPDALSGRTGVLALYSVSGPFDALQPATWVPNLADLGGPTSGLLQKLQLTDRPDALAKGDPQFPGNVTSNLPGGLDAAEVNTAATAPDFGADSQSAFKFMNVSGNFLDWSPAGYNGPYAGQTQVGNFDLLVNLQQLLVNATGLTFNTTDAGTLFNGLMNLIGGPNGFIKAGDTFNPVSPGTTGDTLQENTGGSATPSAQFKPAQGGVPEPATLLLLGLVCSGGLGYRALRRRKA